MVKVFGDPFKLTYSLGSQWQKRDYAMMKLNFPKRVTLPNGRTSVACYKRIPRDQLPPNIVMRRTYTQRAAPRGRRCRRAQQGQGIFDFVKKVPRNTLVKSIARKGLEYAPGVYQNSTERVKNKTSKKTKKNEDFKKNYMGTYSIDSITKYINFYEIMKKR